INPHFLNNVLQLIKGMAVEGKKTEEISRLSTLLGKILAYSVYQPYEDVELKEELEYVKNYMEIQNLRYGGRIFYTIDCEPGLENVRISKLLIQPLVENAIEHGIKGKGRGMISISAERERDSICILVNDNGTGIPEPELADMKRKLEAETVYLQEKSIGVLNVNARLKRKYGGRYGIEVISREGAGTTVIIRLPENGEGKDNENITGR
ncbi:MAG: histidine kinase, partial [Eisenbergiella porci]